MLNNVYIPPHTTYDWVDEMAAFFQSPQEAHRILSINPADQVVAFSLCMRRLGVMPKDVRRLCCQIIMQQSPLDAAARLFDDPFRWQLMSLFRSNPSLPYRMGLSNSYLRCLVDDTMSDVDRDGSRFGRRFEALSHDCILCTCAGQPRKSNLVKKYRGAPSVYCPDKGTYLAGICEDHLSKELGGKQLGDAWHLAFDCRLALEDIYVISRYEQIPVYYLRNCHPTCSDRLLTIVRRTFPLFWHSLIVLSHPNWVMSVPSYDNNIDRTLQLTSEEESRSYRFEVRTIAEAGRSLNKAVARYDKEVRVPREERRNELCRFLHKRRTVLYRAFERRLLWERECLYDNSGALSAMELEYAAFLLPAPT